MEPVFLRAAGHPLRWRLLGELAGSDRRVQELTARVGHPQNLVSYHLGRLRKAGVVRSRRSTADGRDTFYRLDLARCAELLAATGAALHPGLRPAAAAPPGTVRGRVLFLCTSNSGRSQLAEALLRHRSGGAVDVVSAGSSPKPVSAHTFAVLAGYGIDLTAARAKHLDEFRDRRFDHVISLCDRVREVCPEFPGHPDVVHWSLPDPGREPDGRAAYARAAAELDERIGFLLHTLATGGTS
ncbi:MarR family transcriptional regulator [Cryptosporangium arvum]|uniref:arsenate reductase/protein-tyrosine-phosphatase family protein n=1 Tax=Cryptosporangium arvum TaxID=80871 RepID=UPI0004B0E0E3|nr:MarR family transcriptional regulator [Cryptosporangium arvum]